MLEGKTSRKKRGFKPLGREKISGFKEGFFGGETLSVGKKKIAGELTIWVYKKRGSRGEPLEKKFGRSRKINYTQYKILWRILGENSRAKVAQNMGETSSKNKNPRREI